MSTETDHAVYDAANRRIGQWVRVEPGTSIMVLYYSTPNNIPTVSGILRYMEEGTGVAMVECKFPIELLRRAFAQPA